MLCCMLALTRSVSTSFCIALRALYWHIVLSTFVLTALVAHAQPASESTRSNLTEVVGLCFAMQTQYSKKIPHQKHNLAPRHVACRAQRLEPFWQGVCLRRVCCSYLDNEAATTTSSPHQEIVKFVLSFSRVFPVFQFWKP